MESEVMSVQEDVVRGALWMDEVDPGWAFRIDVLRLKMNSCSDCILGQRTPRENLPMPNEPGRWDLEFHGFYVQGSAISLDTRLDEWEALRQLWLVEIARRVAA